MEDVASSLQAAERLEQDGLIKEAYFKYINIAQSSLQTLTDTKFVQTSVVTSPKHWPVLISTMRACLAHLETVLETHTPAQPQQPQLTGDQKKPPVPPKPSRMHKPNIPPKPARGNLSRPSSPTHQNAQQQQQQHLQHLQQQPSAQNQKHEDHLQDKSSESSATPHRRPPPPPSSSSSSASSSNHLSRPHSVPSPDHRLASSHRPITQDRLSSATTLASPASNASDDIDPTHLVPAQTNVELNRSVTDHVPLIPAPPLLTTHRILQAKLDDLEHAMKQHRDRKKQLQLQTQQMDPRIEDDLNHHILLCSRQVADTKLTLNRVRTLYMSASTVPSVMQFKPHLIAYQVTLIDAAIFLAIPPPALLAHSAKHPHPRIVASTDFFNYMTRMIEHSILLPQEASARAQLIHYWIKVASRCLDLNNYQSLKAIVSALGTPPVQRLRRTWAYIPKKSAIKLDSLNELTSETDNYARYREHMGMVNATVVNGKSVAQIRAEHYTKPTLPFLGTFLHDSTYLLAACQSSGQSPQQDPRIVQLLDDMRRFQQGPRYAAALPGTYNKQHQKHHFRPSLSNALHRGASGIGRISNNFGFGSSSSPSSDANGNKDSASSSGASTQSILGDDDDDNDNASGGDMEEQQQMAMQYLLMRPWVNQDTVDQLSLLREPPRQKANTINSHRSNSSHVSNGHVSSTGSSIYLAVNNERPTSMDDDYHRRLSDESSSRLSSSSNTSSSLWPFGRRSMDQPSAIGGNQDQPSPTTSSPLSSSVPMTMSTSGPPTAPVVPPRPSKLSSPPPVVTTPPSNDEFKAVLAKRLAKVSQPDTNA
ncbi:ras guanine nucleotide exchange factor domain-containing protein [Gongronella butleri]|nr:ras guanine nucleotide exchange factor domain-containing protein [Gongronella butleri]